MMSATSDGPEVVVDVRANTTEPMSTIDMDVTGSPDNMATIVNMLMGFRLSQMPEHQDKTPEQMLAYVNQITA